MQLLALVMAAAMGCLISCAREAAISPKVAHTVGVCQIGLELTQFLVLLFCALAIFMSFEIPYHLNDLPFSSAMARRESGTSDTPHPLRGGNAPHFEGPARRQRGMQFLDIPFEILEVYGVLPARSHGVLRGEPREFPPMAIDEIHGAIRQSSPGERRDGLNYISKLSFLTPYLMDPPLIQNHKHSQESSCA